MLRGITRLILCGALVLSSVWVSSAQEPREEFLVDWDKPAGSEDNAYTIDTKVGESKVYRWNIQQNGTNWTVPSGYTFTLKYARDLDAIDGAVGIPGTSTAHYVDFYPSTNDFSKPASWVSQVVASQSGGPKVTLADGRISVAKSLRNAPGSPVFTTPVDLDLYTFSGTYLLPNTIPLTRTGQATSYLDLVNGAIRLNLSSSGSATHSDLVSADTNYFVVYNSTGASPTGGLTAAAIASLALADSAAQGTNPGGYATPAEVATNVSANLATAIAADATALSDLSNDIGAMTGNSNQFLSATDSDTMERSDGEFVKMMVRATNHSARFEAHAALEAEIYLFADENGNTNQWDFNADDDYDRIRIRHRTAGDGKSVLEMTQTQTIFRADALVTGVVEALGGFVGDVTGNADTATLAADSTLAGGLDPATFLTSYGETNSTVVNGMGVETNDAGAVITYTLPDLVVATGDGSATGVFSVTAGQVTLTMYSTASGGGSTNWIETGSGYIASPHKVVIGNSTNTSDNAPFLEINTASANDIGIELAVGGYIGSKVATAKILRWASSDWMLYDHNAGNQILWVDDSPQRILSAVTGDWDWQWYNAPNYVMSIDMGERAVSIGTSTPDAGGHNTLQFADGSFPASYSQAGIVATNGELYAYDSGGTATLLTDALEAEAPESLAVSTNIPRPHPKMHASGVRYWYDPNLIAELLEHYARAEGLIPADKHLIVYEETGGTWEGYRTAQTQELARVQREWDEKHAQALRDADVASLNSMPPRPVIRDPGPEPAWRSNIRQRVRPATNRVVRVR